MADMTIPIVLDVDTGTDDALAILYAVSHPDLEVLGISCVAGNSGLDQVVINTNKVLDAAGAPDIPVAAGARQPLFARVDAQHLSAAESVEVVAAAKAHGVSITCEASPHHLTLTDEAVLSLDTRLKMNPPLRTEADRLALVAGLRDGTIDCIATDHAPHAREEKEVPFEEAPMGTTGLETAFAAIHTDLVLPGVLPLGLVVEKLSAGAALLDLPTPSISVGRPADLCLVDLGRVWEVGEAGYESRSENCCFAGRTLSGRVLVTLAAGSVAYRERAFALSAA